MRTIDLSIVTAFEERERLEQQAKFVWEQLADRLMELIPESLRPFATEKGWLKGETYKIDHWWPLPEWLQSLVVNTRYGGCNSESYSQDHLADYGFKSFDDLKAKFHELETAWRGLVHIVIDDSEGYRVEVSYFATEVTSKWVIEFRNGGYFQNLEANNSGSVETAMTFDSKEAAEVFMDDHNWLYTNGGMAKRVKPTNN